MATTTLRPGAVRSFDVSYTDPATIVGSPPQWADSSDATYAVAFTPTSGLPTSPQATIDPMPPARSINTAILHVRTAYLTTQGFSGGLNVEWRDTTADPEGSRTGVNFIGAADDTPFTDYTTALDSDVWGLLMAGTLAANIFALVGGGFEATATVSELWIEVDYTGTAPAPLRIYPRSSTRLYPRRQTRRPGTF